MIRWHEIAYSDAVKMEPDYEVGEESVRRNRDS